MLNTVKDTMLTIGEETGDLAKRFGAGTVRLAKQIGPTRAIVGAVVVTGLVIGSVVLVRYLRNRRAEVPYDASADEHMPQHRNKRANKRGAEQYSH